jgi:phage gp29-like protein
MAARRLEDALNAAGGNMEDENEDGAEMLGVDGLIEVLMGALLPGYAVVEKCWSGGGDLAGFSAIPQSAVIFRDGRPMIVVDGEAQGVPVDRRRYIWHRGVRRGADAARGGLVRPLAWLFCFANVGVKDLVSFVERHGMPFIVGKVDDGGVRQERDAVKRLIRNFGPSGGGVFSRNVEVQLMECSSQGDVYFRLLSYIDDAVTKLLLGQTASSGESAGLSKGDAQSKVRQDILEADCRRVADCIQRQVVAQWMRYNAPALLCPRFMLEYEAPEDKTALAQTVNTLSQAGFQADADEMSKRFGMKLTYKEPQNAGNGFAPMPMGGEQKTPPTRENEGSADGFLERLDAMLDMSDEEFAAAVEAEERRIAGGNDAVGAEKVIAKVERTAAKAGMNNKTTRK